MNRRPKEERSMRRRTIRRAMLMVVGVMLFVGLSPEIAYASGGGGCGGPVTDDDGTRVSIRNSCFGPTILRVQPGETVTWVNRDAYPHIVLGANGAWGGYENVKRNGGVASYRFVSSGVYPYVCTYHPGMIGAVVVGNGKPDGAAYAVTTNAGPVISADPTGTAIERVVPAPVPARSWAPVALGFGLILVVATAIANSRRRRDRGTMTH
jgi:plastocyanin